MECHRNAIGRSILSRCCPLSTRGLQRVVGDGCGDLRVLAKGIQGETFITNTSHRVTAHRHIETAIITKVRVNAVSTTLEVANRVIGDLSSQRGIAAASTSNSIGKGIGTEVDTAAADVQLNAVGGIRAAISREANT